MITAMNLERKSKQERTNLESKKPFRKKITNLERERIKERM